MGRKTNQASRTLSAAGLILGYLILAALPVVLAFTLSPHPVSSFARELGKGAALVGFALMALQVILAGRFRFVDRRFGLDVVMRFHRRMGMLIAPLLVAHPVLLAVDAGSAWLFSFDTGWRIGLGKLALGLLLLSAMTMLCCRRRIDYLVRRFIHGKAAAVVLLLGFAHGLVIGSDLRSTGMRVYWWTLLALVAAIFVYRGVIVRFWGRRRFRVADVKRETHDTWSLTFEPEEGGRLDYLPGQFMFLELPREGFRTEEHPFTISSCPTREDGITATIKESGDFTETIGRSRAGDRALIAAPFGRFSFLHHEPKSFLFIAGGVGVTPVMSMLRYLRDTADARPAALVYGNKKASDIIFREELEKFPSHIKVTHVLSDPEPDWQGPRGYVTAEIIKECCGELLSDADVYLCGPPPMMKQVIRALRTLGVRGSRIHYERFAL